MMNKRAIISPQDQSNFRKSDLLEHTLARCQVNVISSHARQAGCNLSDLDFKNCHQHLVIKYELFISYFGYANNHGILD